MNSLGGLISRIQTYKYYCHKKRYIVTSIYLFMIVLGIFLVIVLIKSNVKKMFIHLKCYYTYSLVKFLISQSAGAVEYIDCISEER